MGKGIICEVRDRAEFGRKLQALQDAPEKALKAMNRDAKKQVKGWVNAEIVKIYNVTPEQIKTKKLGTIRVNGKIQDSLEFQYRGRPLTPTHFDMTPRSPNRGGYTLSATFYRGHKKKLGEVKELTPAQRKRLARNFKRKNLGLSRKSPAMLLPTGNKKDGGTNYIPFQRMSTNRRDIKALKTISFPQMVSSKRASKQIHDAVYNGMSKQLDTYMKKYLPGD